MNHFTMSRNSRDLSRRHFHWKKKVGSDDDDEVSTFKSSSNKSGQQKKQEAMRKRQPSIPTPRKKLPAAVSVARLRSVFAALGKSRASIPFGLGRHIVGTLFGYRHGHVRFAFQREPDSPPAFLVELTTPVSRLVREMASGLVRIALECSKGKEQEEGTAGMRQRLLEEPLWRAYCNGKKCGYATRRECSAEEWKVLKAVQPISTGAGALPAANGEVVYMRARFERIVGSRDSEAFYMMNPDCDGAPELSVYLLRL